MDREKKIKIKNKGTRTSRRARTKLANSPLALLFRPRTITRTSKNELKKNGPNPVRWDKGSISLLKQDGVLSMLSIDTKRGWNRESMEYGKVGPPRTHTPYTVQTTENITQHLFLLCPQLWRQGIFPMLFASWAIVIMLLAKSVMQCDWPGAFPEGREPRAWPSTKRKLTKVARALW